MSDAMAADMTFNALGRLNDKSSTWGAGKTTLTSSEWAGGFNLAILFKRIHFDWRVSKSADDRGGRIDMAETRGWYQPCAWELAFLEPLCRRPYSISKKLD